MTPSGRISRRKRMASYRRRKISGRKWVTSHRGRKISGGEWVTPSGRRRRIHHHHHVWRDWWIPI
jgi:hypothetical protein